MIQFGIRTQQQLRSIGANRKQQGFRIALPLLDVGTDPSPGEVAEFEEMSYTVRLSNGTYRTSHRDRFVDVNRVVGSILRGRFSADQTFRVEDRAVSHGLTAWEWAEPLLGEYPNASFEASDLVVELVELSLSDGTKFVAEPGGAVLQYIRPPFVVPIQHRGPRRYPLNEIVSMLGRRRLRELNLPADWVSRSSVEGGSIRRFPFVHPLARKLAATDSRFRVICKSVFDDTPSTCEVLRTMNILIPAYFCEATLLAGVAAAHKSVVAGGIWLVGRTTLDTFVNNASILGRTDTGWELVERINGGSEIEQLALDFRV